MIHIYELKAFRCKKSYYFYNGIQLMKTIENKYWLYSLKSKIICRENYNTVLIFIGNFFVLTLSILEIIIRKKVHSISNSLNCDIEICRNIFKAILYEQISIGAFGDINYSRPFVYDIFSAYFCWLFYIRHSCSLY